MLLQSYQSHRVLHSWPELCCVFLKRVDIWEIDHVCQVMATIWHHYWIFLLLLKLQPKLRTQIFVQNLSRSLCTFLHLLMGADTSVGIMQLVFFFIHCEGDGLMLCEWQSQGYVHTHSCCLCFGLAGTEIMSTFKVVLIQLSLQSCSYRCQAIPETLYCFNWSCNTF
jgi:hypothetical protein